MPVVRYAAYRQYERSRVDASNALMALLAGAQLANHLLKLNEGSDRLLPEVYPNVPHIGRVNLKADTAAEILRVADTHLGAMSVPYALAIHEDYMRSCLELLAGAGLLSASKAKVNSFEQHTNFEDGTGATFDIVSLAQLTTLRHMRNARIHNGSRASKVLVDQLQAWPVGADAGWTKVTGRSPRFLAEGDVVEFGHGEMLLALAVTTRLDRQANEILQGALPRATWASMVIDDLLSANSLALSRSDSLRKARGIARHHFDALKLTEAELTSAMATR